MLNHDIQNYAFLKSNVIIVKEAYKYHLDPEDPMNQTKNWKGTFSYLSLDIFLDVQIPNILRNTCWLKIWLKKKFPGGVQKNRGVAGGSHGSLDSAYKEASFSH